MIIAPFENYTERYDDWFETHRFVYESELAAVRKVLPHGGNGVEIGVGSGRFAAPLRIRTGVEPSKKMRALARARGVDAVDGTAERLPFADGFFDFALFVTTICFLDDIGRAFREADRVVKKNGCVIVGFVEKNSRLGREYREKKDENVFYREAVFYSREEVVSCLEAAAFHDLTYYQTLFRPLSEVTQPEPVREGFGDGSFLVIRGMK